MKNITAIIEKTINGKYEIVNSGEDFTKEYLCEKLMEEMKEKYLCKATWVKNIKRENRFNGTEKVIVTYDNGYRTIYTIES